MTIIYSAGPAVKGMLVDSTGSALTRSVARSRAQDASSAGQGYTLNTGEIGLTVATDTAILYYKHFEDTDLEIDSVIVGIADNGTDSNPSSKITIVRNPTAGDIISGASAGDIIGNRNFSNVSALDNSTFYKGAAGGSTMTDGEDFAIAYGGYGRTVLPLNLNLFKGNSLGIKLDLQANTGTVNVYCAIVCNLRQGDRPIRL